MPVFDDDFAKNFENIPKKSKRASLPWNCCGASSVQRLIRRNPLAKALLRKEQDRLRAINTWREDLVGEWDDV
jgi:uncharacterized metal-binding protein